MKAAIKTIRYAFAALFLIVAICSAYLFIINHHPIFYPLMGISFLIFFCITDRKVVEHAKKNK